VKVGIIFISSEGFFLSACSGFRRATPPNKALARFRFPALFSPAAGNANHWAAELNFKLMEEII